jgi:hypothetical protein
VIATNYECEAQEQLARIERIQWERQCRRDLTAWTIEALAPMEQTPARHHQLLLRHLEMVAHGKINRLMVFMPPGSAKSSYCSVLFPAWMFAQRPNFDMIGASHGSDLAEDFSGRIQRYIEHNKDILGYELASENVKRWRTTNGGFYRAAGIGGSITGRRANGGLIDDPLRGAADAESLVVRESQWQWYQAEFYTRLKPGAWIILIQTRWHADDLGGRLLQAMAAGGDQWVVLKLPAICDASNDPLARPIGTALWPEWQDETALATIRSNVGEHVWGALYQQDPKPRGASFFSEDSLLVDQKDLHILTGVIASDRSFLRIPAPTPTKCDRIFAIIDTAIKSGQEHNSTAVVWCSHNTLTEPISTLILDYDICQVEGAAQEAWLPSVHIRGEELARQCGAIRGYQGAFIEDKATGTVLIQQSQNLAKKQGKPPLAYPIPSTLTALGKEERALAAAPYVIAGNIKITQPAYNKVKVHKGRSANHLITQITDFRLGSKQKDGLDLLDTFCYAVLMTRGTSSGERKGI